MTAARLLPAKPQHLEHICILQIVDLAVTHQAPSFGSACQERDSRLSCVGALQTAIRACVAGGKVVMVGLGSEEAKIPLSTAACKELDIMGSFRYCNTVRSTLTATA